MHLFSSDLVARVFLEQDALAFHELEQPVVRIEAFLLVFVRFDEDLVDLVLVGLEQ